MTTNNNNATSVIDDLESQDTSFDKRYSDTLAQIQAVKDWYHTIQCEVSNARSTEIDGGDWNSQQLTTSFYIKISTTKKAISDKRFEELLSVPPTGWSLFGLNKSRQDGEIVAQYMKDSDYPVTAEELMLANLSDLLDNYQGQIDQRVANAEKTITTIITEIGNYNYSRAERLKEYKDMKTNFTRILSAIELERSKLESGIDGVGTLDLFSQSFNDGSSGYYCNTRLDRQLDSTYGFLEWYYTDYAPLSKWRKGDLLPYLPWQCKHKLY